MFLARLVSEVAVLAMLNNLEPYGSHVPAYGEISAAMAKASNEDPLFPQHEAGSEVTACILVALAHQESRFHPNVIGDKGKSFGLYQIQPPTAKVDGSLLLIPVNASFVAVDLIRQSFSHCSARPWPERLSWYVASNGCPSHPVIVKKSMERLILAQELFRKHFPKSVLPTALPAKGETGKRE